MNLDLANNPICEKENYKARLFEIFPKLEVRSSYLLLNPSINIILNRSSTALTKMETKLPARKKMTMIMVKNMETKKKEKVKRVMKEKKEKTEKKTTVKRKKNMAKKTMVMKMMTMRRPMVI